MYGYFTCYSTIYLLLVNHHFNVDDCTDECGFELRLTIELCKASGTEDEESFRDCLVNHFTPDHVNNESIDK